MRISAHKLPVESGRYTKTPYEDRVCTLCQSNELEMNFTTYYHAPTKTFQKLEILFKRVIWYQ